MLCLQSRCVDNLASILKLIERLSRNAFETIPSSPRKRIVLMMQVEDPELDPVHEAEIWPGHEKINSTPRDTLHSSLPLNNIA